MAENEQQTVVVQRRCLRATRDLKAGTVLKEDMLEALRPAPADAMMPFELDGLLGKKLTCDLAEGEYLQRVFLTPAERGE